MVGTNYAALKWLVTDFADVDELNFLAKCLDSFDKNELNIFEAVCETREPRSVVKMINITYNTYNYTLVQDMSSMEIIGRTHFKAVHIGWNPGEMENVNLAEIGRGLMNSGKGKMTEKGMLFEHEGAKFINEYDGHNFPEYLYDPCRIFVELKKDDRKEYLYLPTHELTIKKALKRLGATNTDECSIKLEDKETDNLWFERIQDITASENLYAANNVLRAVEKAEKNNELDKLEAVIDFAYRYDSASIIKLEDNIDSFRYFDNAYDKEGLYAEKFCNTKSALFLIMPEEDNTKYFLISLIVQQLYREMLAIAYETNGKLKNRVMFYLDEIGTIPKIDSAEMMFSAGRSRRISIIAIIQSKAQLEKNYGKEGAEIIWDNCQLTVFGGFAPNSETAEVMSKNHGEQTILSGSVTQSRNDGSRSLQMISRPLMTVDELKTLPRFHFIITKTGCHPMRTKLDLFFKWGIELNSEYIVEKKEVKTVHYAGKDGLMREIERREGIIHRDTSSSAVSGRAAGGTAHTPITERDVMQQLKGGYEVDEIKHKARSG